MDDTSLDEIRIKFVESLEGWKTIVDSLHQASDYEGLRSQCHRIKGTAAMLGLHPLSEASAAAETAFDSSREQDTALPVIELLLDAVYRQIDALTQRNSS